MVDLQTQMKNAVAKAAVEKIKDGMVLGLGSGSTAALMIEELADKLSKGEIKDIVGVTTVSDICDGFLEIYKSNKFYGEVINLGSNNKISIEKLMIMIQNLMNVKIKSNYILLYFYETIENNNIHVNER